MITWDCDILEVRGLDGRDVVVGSTTHVEGEQHDERQEASSSEHQPARPADQLHPRAPE